MNAPEPDGPTFDRTQLRAIAGGQEATALPIGTAPAGDGVYPLLTARELIDAPPPSWMIEGVMPHGFCVLHGPPGSFKSFLALDWALCIASGLQWHGRATEPGWVVYVAAEGRGGLGQRVEAWLDHHHVDDVDRARFLPETVNFLDSGALDKIARTLAELPERPGLLVVDTMARSIPGADENASQDVGQFVSAVDLIRGQHSALVVHHNRKGDDEERGSGSLRGAADLMVRVKREGLTENVTLSCSKLKEAPEWEPIEMRLVDTSDSAILDVPIPPPLFAPPHIELQDAVLRALREEPEPVSGSHLARALGRRRERVLRVLKDLEVPGKVVAEGAGPATRWRLP